MWDRHILGAKGGFFTEIEARSVSALGRLFLLTYARSAHRALRDVKAADAFKIKLKLHVFDHMCRDIAAYRFNPDSGPITPRKH